jgi:CheY-like chemotaxis protein
MSTIKRVLLIDDDDVNNFINARLLRKLSITEDIKISSNGEEGLRYLQELSSCSENFPDLILLDINMPVMDGFEFLERFSTLHFDGKRPTVIMLTTSSNEKDLHQLYQYPEVAGYLNKPLNEAKFISIFQKHFAVDTPEPKMPVAAVLANR